MSEIKRNLEKFHDILSPYKAKLVAVTKTKPVEDIMEAYKTGFNRFGENKVQELVSKYEQLPKDIEWHMIGHLQRNKVKYIAPFVHLIHSVDSLKLLREINKQGDRVNRKIRCLLQVHIAEESTKFGLSEKELFGLLKSEELMIMDHVEVSGLMGMATNTKNETIICKEFRFLKNVFEKARTLNDQKQINISEISMGMSNDFKIALEEGGTLIRVGSAIFGLRNSY